MRIVWITERHPPDNGGMAVSSNRLVNALRDRGHGVDVLHLAGTTGHHVPFRLNALEGYTRAEGWQRDLERVFFLQRRALEGRLLIGFGGGLPGYLASLWGTWLERPSVAMFRGNDLDRLCHDPRQGWLVHETLRRAGLVCAVATEMRDRIATMGAGEVRWTPNGIIPEEWAIFPADQAAAIELRARHSPLGLPLVGMFGQLKYKKGLTTAIQMFRNYGLGRWARLLTVGDLPEAERRELENDCAGFWSHAPFMPRGSLLPYYLACDVTLIPSLFDGMPNVLLEAMLCGAPVVASRVGGIPDVISHGVDGFLFHADDPVGAADALTHALSLSPDARREIGLAGRTTILNRFTGVREADILEAALSRMAGA